MLCVKMNCMLCSRSCISKGNSTIPSYILLLFQGRGNGNPALVTSVICQDETGVLKQNRCTRLVAAQSPGPSPNELAGLPIVFAYPQRNETTKKVFFVYITSPLLERGFSQLFLLADLLCKSTLLSHCY